MKFILSGFFCVNCRCSSPWGPRKIFPFRIAAGKHFQWRHNDSGNKPPGDLQVLLFWFVIPNFVTSTFREKLLIATEKEV